MSKWVNIFESTNTNLTEIIKSLLEDYNIRVVVVDKMDSMHKHLLNGNIEILVRQEDVLKAKHLISKNNLLC